MSWGRRKSRGGEPVPPLGPDMLQNPLFRLTRRSLGSDLKHVREGRLRGVSLWEALHRLLTRGCTLGASVCHLVAGGPAVPRDPSDGDFIEPCEDAYV